ncbi:MAG: hypothetical protein JRN20_11005 [Nitrososphaerota archaeon]|nr:hypothetical protein [Nitrososphaerota archaeon]
MHGKSRYQLRSKPITLLSALILVALATSPAFVQAQAQGGVSIIQSKIGSCNPCTSTNLSLSLATSVAQGDVVVVGIDSSASPVTGVSDSLGTSYVQAISSQNTGNVAVIFDGTLATSGVDTITVYFSAIPSGADLYIYEIGGAATTGVSASGGGTGTLVSTSTSVSFQSNVFLLGIVSTNSSVAEGTGFTSIAGSAGIAQYAVAGVSSPTDFPATLSSSANWAEAAIALDPAATTTVTSSATSTLTTTVTSTETSRATTTSTATSTSVSTLTTTSISTVTVTSTSVPSSSLVTITATTTETVNRTVTGSSVVGPSSILVYAYASGGKPIAQCPIALANSSGYSVTANTNSSGIVSFYGLTPGSKYLVSSTIEGANLSAPVTVDKFGGNLIVVLEPSPDKITVTTNTPPTTMESSTAGGNDFGIEALAIDIGAAVMISVTVIILARKRSKSQNP